MYERRIATAFMAAFIALCAAACRHSNGTVDRDNPNGPGDPSRYPHDMSGPGVLEDERSAPVGYEGSQYGAAVSGGRESPSGRPEWHLPGGNTARATH